MRAHLHDKSLTELEHLLPPGFLRVHRSCIVNLRCVASRRNKAGSRYEVLLTTGGTLPVVRSRVAALRAPMV